MEEASDISAAPPPTFDDLPLSDELKKAIDDLGYTHPTPVQRAVFEPAKRGVDLVVQARTGTGKTAAFGMPIVDSLIKRNQDHVQALILCPTRELALQVSRELEALGKYRGVKPVAVYGGAPMPRQVEQIKQGAQVLVGTPGRVLDHLQRRTLDVSQLRLFVLDESDEMLSMGFLPQIDQIQRFLPETHQTLLFSATLPPDIQRLAETRLRNPEFLTLSGDHIGALEITHFVYLSRGDKLAEFIKVLEVEDPESAIVFCNTRDETKRVASALQQQGFTADWLNADLAQSDREKVMTATRGGDLRFLVCTDVAARGIDISHLTHVINYDYPEAAENYVHRTGRTGRAGRTGTAISLIAPSDIGNLYLTRLIYKIRTIEKQLPSAREIKTRAETDLVDMFVQAFAERAVHSDDIALGRRLMTHEFGEKVIAGLLRDHLGARPEAQDEATAARHSRRPRQSDRKVPAPRAPLIVSHVETAVPSNAEDGQGLPLRRSRRRRDQDRDRSEAELPPGQKPDHSMPAGANLVAEAESPVAPLDTAPISTAGGSSEIATAVELNRGQAPAEAVPTQELGQRNRRRGQRSTERYRSEPRSADHGSGRAERATEEFEFSYTVSDVDVPPRPAAEAHETTDAQEPRLAEIYVNVGRKDGASESDFASILAERAGLSADDTAYIHVRNRHTFVAVSERFLEKARSALDGATVAGKKAAAEPARSRE